MLCFLISINKQMALLFDKLVKGGSYVGYLSFFCLHWITSESISHLHWLKLTYYSELHLSLAFCFIYIYMIGLTEICPSLISLLYLFQGIICNIERLKRGSESPALLSGEKYIKRGT